MNDRPYPEYKIFGYKSLYTDVVKFTENPFEYSDDKTKEHYSSWYRFKDDLLKHGSFRDLPKEMMFYADYLPIDIDVGSGETQMREACLLTSRLVDVLLKNRCAHETWFSGNKGFHVLIPTHQFGFKPTNNPNILKTMAIGLAKIAKINIDVKIYNPTRVFRLPNSFNKKACKYKERASVGSDSYIIIPDDSLPPWMCAKNEFLTKVYNKALEIVTDAERKSKLTVTDNGLYNKIFKPVYSGDRNNSCYKITKMLREKNMCEEDIYFSMGIWNRECVNPPLPDIELKNTMRSAFKGGVRHVVDPSRKVSVLGPNEVLTKIKATYEKLEKNTVKTGYEFLDKYTMGFLPGELIFWIATNGNFKSCYLYNILANISQNSGKFTLLFNLDMPEDSAWIRTIQMAERISYKESISRIKTGGNLDGFKKVYDKFRIINIKMPTVDHISGYIDKFVAEHGKLAAIGFDYLGAFKGCDNDPKTTGETIHALSSLASNICMCPVFCLVQARREYEGKGGNVEIDKSAGKDSSVIEHKGDFVYGSWWHWGQGGHKHYWGRSLKNRRFDNDYCRENAYFKIKMEPEHMYLNDIMKYDQKRLPEFAQKFNKKDW